MSNIKLTSNEFEDKLVKTFPKLYVDMGGDMSKTCMAFGIGVDSGWYDLIWELSEKLEPLIQGTDIRAAQVKEKFGSLRFYMSGYNDEIRDIVSYYEDKSSVTCEICGDPGQIRRTGWHKALCDVHAKK